MAEKKEPDVKKKKKCECGKGKKIPVVRLRIPKDFRFGNELDNALYEVGEELIASGKTLLVVTGRGDEEFRLSVTRMFYEALEKFVEFSKEDFCKETKNPGQLAGMLVSGDEMYGEELRVANAILDLNEVVMKSRSLNYGMRRLINNPRVGVIVGFSGDESSVIALLKNKSEARFRRRLKIKKSDKFTVARLYICNCPKEEGKKEEK